MHHRTLTLLRREVQPVPVGAYAEALRRWQRVGDGVEGEAAPNRTLQQLRKMGVASIERQRLTIHDWPRLKAIADFDAAYLHLGERSDGAEAFDR